MKPKILISASSCLLATSLVFSSTVLAGHHADTKNHTIKKQQAELAKNTDGKGFGPQSPRDIDAVKGNNTRLFATAPPHSQMNLCNIHFHKYAEHKGGDFTKFAGAGDGKGHETGFLYSGKLSSSEKKPYKKAVCDGKGDSLKAGDTIEVHYVHTTAQVTPGPTLGACLSESIMNPQLRVEAQVFVLVNDKNAHDFNKLTSYGKNGGLYQVDNIPNNTGTPVTYAGSTTGPSYNKKGSPLQVTWNVRPQTAKVNIASVAKWCEKNDFNEDHGHGVRNLVINPDLLSEIKP